MDRTMRRAARAAAPRDGAARRLRAGRRVVAVRSLEVWRRDCARPTMGPSVYDSAARWLRSCGLSTGTRLPNSIRATRRARGEVWLPDAGHGLPARRRRARSTRCRSAIAGCRLWSGRRCRSLAEMFRRRADARPQVAALWGPPGSGKRVVVGELARIARMNGFVPVAARLVASRQAELWRGRSLFVIADAAEETAWPALLNARAAATRSRTCCCSSARKSADRSAASCIGADRDRSAGVGDSAARCSNGDSSRRCAAPPSARTVCRAGSRGCCGRSREERQPCAIVRASQRRLSRVAEQTADLRQRTTPAGTCSIAGVVAVRRGRRRASWRRCAGRWTHAIADLARGRHAPGIRQLRQVVGEPGAPGRLERRGERRARAGRRAAAARRRPREALAVIGDGRDYATRAGEAATLIDLAVFERRGVDRLGRGSTKPTACSATALAAARALQDPERVAAASLALARACTGAATMPTPRRCLPRSPDAAAARRPRGRCSPRASPSACGDLSARDVARWPRRRRRRRDGERRRQGRHRLGGGARFTSPSAISSARRARPVGDARAGARRPRSAARASAPACCAPNSSGRAAARRPRSRSCSGCAALMTARAGDRARALGPCAARCRHRMPPRRHVVARHIAEHRPWRAALCTSRTRAVRWRMPHGVADRVRRRARRDPARLPDGRRRGRAAEGGLRAPAPASPRGGGRVRRGQRRPRDDRRLRRGADRYRDRRTRAAAGHHHRAASASTIGSRRPPRSSTAARRSARCARAGRSDRPTTPRAPARC